MTRDSTLAVPEVRPDTFVEAEYADGYVHSELRLGDASAHVEGKNVFHDILNRLPEAEHGPMIRFSCFWKGIRYDADFSHLPDNARPVRFRHGFSTYDPNTREVIASGWTGVDFGYQFNDAEGRNRQNVVELR